MKVLQIHEVKDWMLKLDLSDFDILTFDDGLFSQYIHHEHFSKFGKPMYFFITSGIVCDDARQQPLCAISCDEAHEEYFRYGSKIYYMTWDQIKEINSKTNYFIGGHSHTHPILRGMPIQIQKAIAEEESINMLNEFKNQGIAIHSFCYPYNFEALGYKYYLSKFGINKFFGKERTPIEELKCMQEL